MDLKTLCCTYDTKIALTPYIDNLELSNEAKERLLTILNATNTTFSWGLEDVEVVILMFETPEEETQFIMATSLDDFSEFKDRIYPADQFFKAMTDLSFDKINDLIDDPDILLEKNGRIVRAGIWNETKAGYIKLGFEYKHQSQTNVLLVNGREWVVWELIINLKGSNI